MILVQILISDNRNNRGGNPPSRPIPLRIHQAVKVDVRPDLHPRPAAHLLELHEHRLAHIGVKRRAIVLRKKLRKVLLRMHPMGQFRSLRYHILYIKNQRKMSTIRNINFRGIPWVYIHR